MAQYNSKVHKVGKRSQFGFVQHLAILITGLIVSPSCEFCNLDKIKASIHFWIHVSPVVDTVIENCKYFF